ncbi:hypothetical protein ON010_g8121 [Phytophthora cinnamomi]|nr:hypothetical protein ON010_g8121 [Phytophthora cinnamomi]
MSAAKWCNDPTTISSFIQIGTESVDFGISTVSNGGSATVSIDTVSKGGSAIVSVEEGIDTVSNGGNAIVSVDVGISTVSNGGRAIVSVDVGISTELNDGRAIVSVDVGISTELSEVGAATVSNAGSDTVSKDVGISKLRARFGFFAFGLGLAAWGCAALELAFLAAPPAPWCAPASASSFVKSMCWTNASTTFLASSSSAGVRNTPGADSLCPSSPVFSAISALCPPSVSSGMKP